MMHDNNDDDDDDNDDDDDDDLSKISKCPLTSAIFPDAQILKHPSKHNNPSGKQDKPWGHSRYHAISHLKMLWQKLCYYIIDIICLWIFQKRFRLFWKIIPYAEDINNNK